MAFPLDTGPFGEEPFDAFPDIPAIGTYKDVKVEECVLYLAEEGLIMRTAGPNGADSSFT